MAKWEKGRSGNVGGRPKEIGDVRVLARKRTKEAIDTLTAIMNDKYAPAASRVAASIAILDRGFGKPTLPIENLTPEPNITLDEAARRIAFAMNAAIDSGRVIEGELTKLIEN